MILEGFIHPRWLVGISSINSIIGKSSFWVFLNRALWPSKIHHCCLMRFCGRWTLAKNRGCTAGFLSLGWFGWRWFVTPRKVKRCLNSIQCSPTKTNFLKKIRPKSTKSSPHQKYFFPEVVTGSPLKSHESWINRSSPLKAAKIFADSWTGFCLGKSDSPRSNPNCEWL